MRLHPRSTTTIAKVPEISMPIRPPITAPPPCDPCLNACSSNLPDCPGASRVIVCRTTCCTSCTCNAVATPTRAMMPGITVSTAPCAIERLLVNPSPLRNRANESFSSCPHPTRCRVCLASSPSSSYVSGTALADAIGNLLSSGGSASRLRRRTSLRSEQRSEPLRDLLPAFPHESSPDEQDDRREHQPSEAGDDPVDQIDLRVQEVAQRGHAGGPRRDRHRVEREEPRERHVAHPGGERHERPGHADVP